MSDENEIVQLPSAETTVIGSSSDTEAPKSYLFQEFADSDQANSVACCEQSNGLRIEFAERLASRHDIDGWKRGELVPFDEPISSLVRIVIGGVVVGQGELVEVDGHVAVRVTEVQDVNDRRAA